MFHEGSACIFLVHHCIPTPGTYAHSASIYWAKEWLTEGLEKRAWRQHLLYSYWEDSARCTSERWDYAWRVSLWQMQIVTVYNSSSVLLFCNRAHLQACNYKNNRSPSFFSAGKEATTKTLISHYSSKCPIRGEMGRIQATPYTKIMNTRPKDRTDGGSSRIYYYLHMAVYYSILYGSSN